MANQQTLFPRRSKSDGVFSDSRRSFIRSSFALLASTVLMPLARAGESLWTTYQTPEAFVAEAFKGNPPPPKVASGPSGPVHYWRANGRSVWVIEDLGKQGYQLTTAGFIVKNGAIESAKVLVYRESRGEQVAEPSFLQKFLGARLAGGNLDRNIDNISGATLSVQMMQRMARTVLTLDASAG
jgi:hypothetical protein